MVVDPWTDLVVLVLAEQQEGVLEQEVTFTDKEQELVDNREDTAGRWGDQVKVDTTTSEIVWIIKNKIKIPFNCSFVNKLSYSFYSHG